MARSGHDNRDIICDAVDDLSGRYLVLSGAGWWRSTGRKSSVDVAVKCW